MPYNIETPAVNRIPRPIDDLWQETGLGNDVPHDVTRTAIFARPPLSNSTDLQDSVREETAYARDGPKVSLECVTTTLTRYGKAADDGSKCCGMSIAMDQWFCGRARISHHGESRQRLVR